MSTLYLGVNIDHIATLRNARGGSQPDPLQAAIIAEHSGASSITIHLREDRRHITDNDVQLLRQIIKTRMNLEIAATDEMIDIACKIKPNYCCLVPEKRQELTTEGGLDIIKQYENIKHAVKKLISSGIQVSLFVDAEKDQISSAFSVGAPCVEIHTGSYSNAFESGIRSQTLEELDRINNSIVYAKNLGLKVNAGHGLNYLNVGLIAELPGISELNIGHSIINRALIVGLDRAVKDMVNLIQKARR